MSKTKINYSFFSSFIIRTPSYPISFYHNLTNGTVIENNEVREILKDHTIEEALFLASPELNIEIKKWITQENYPSDKANRVKLSALKYLTRMSTRCTPFALFAACGLGRLSDKTSININYGFNPNNDIDNKSSFYRRTRFDMQFLANLGKTLTVDMTIQDQLIFYPNTTLYKLGDFYRYIEYILNQNKRKYSLEALKRSDYLDLVLQKAVLGCTKNELASVLVSGEINNTEALEFIEELITYQILVSEAELTLTGDDFLRRLINMFNSIATSQEINYPEKNISEFKKDKEIVNKALIFLKSIDNQLSAIDTTMDNSFFYYEGIKEAIEKTNINFDKKYLFQTDLFLDSTSLELDEKYTHEILKATEILNKISESPKNTLLENFKKGFIERYDGETIPLVKALDVETGIGYLQRNSNFDVTDLLDTLGIKEKSYTDNQTNLNEVERIIYNKLQNDNLQNQNSLVLSNKDFVNIDFSNENLPITFSCLFEIVEENGKEWIIIQSIGGSSAANLLARFCYGSEQINDLANEITKYESDYFSDKIIAEIVHLPETRTGNILRRPSFRDYEIPYLGQSSLPISQQINIEDLLLCVKNNRLVLWSKKFKKEIIPRLTNAHNYTSNALPIYHFLCDLQFENCKPSIEFYWGNLQKLFDYFPRVTFGNCILSKEKWVFSKEKHPDFFKKLNENHKIFDKNIFSFTSGIFIKPLPQYISLIDGDNILIVNMDNDTCIEMLVETIKKRSQFVLEEFLFPSSKMVTGNKDFYSNQFIVGLKRNKKVMQNG